MKRFIFSCLLVLAGAYGGKAQQIDSVFIAVPEAVLPLLEYNSRLDMLDLYNCGMKAKVYNDLSGETCLMEKDSVSFLVKTSSSSYLQLRVLSKGRDTLYSCIRTVEVPEKQSQVIFFDKNWQEVKMKLPKEIDFASCWSPIDSLGENRAEMLRRALSTSYFTMHWTATKSGTPLLVYELSVDGLSPKDRKDARRCLKPLEFAWQDGKLVKVTSAVR